MTWLDVPARGTSDTDDLLALLPAAYAGLRDLHARIWAGDVDPLLLELCRLRMAQLVGSTADLAIRHDAAVTAGLTEELVAALPRWPTSPLFTDGQRAVLAFAEQYTIDAQGVTDDMTARVREHLDDRQVAQLTTALALFDGLARVRAVLAAAPAATAVAGTTADDPLH